MAEPLAGEVRNSFETLMADGERRLEAIDAALDQIAPQYRGRSEDRSYKQFIEALRLANSAARRRMERIADDANSSAEERYDSLYSLLQSFPTKHEKLVRALQADRHEALEVFAQPFTRLAKSLLPNVEVLFFSWARDAYEISIYDAERARDLTPGAAVSLRREFGEEIQFLQLWHPSLRESALFQHAVFGHELGHPAIRRQAPGSVREALGSSTDDATFASVALDAALEQEADVAAGLEDEQKAQLVKWFDEIACDLIGMRLFGPAFVIGFVEATSTNRHFEPRTPGEFRLYPPPRLRFEFLGRELSGYELGSREARIRPLLDRLVSAPLQPTDPEELIPGSAAILHRAVELFSEHCVGTLLGDEILDSAELRDDLEGVWLLLDMDVPPAEKLTVTEAELPEDEDELAPWSVEYGWRSILNGVSLWALDQIEHLDRPAERAMTRARATRVATGAIEMAEFQRRARILRGQFSKMRLVA